MAGATLVVGGRRMLLPASNTIGFDRNLVRSEFRLKARSIGTLIEISFKQHLICDPSYWLVRFDHAGYWRTDNPTGAALDGGLPSGHLAGWSILCPSGNVHMIDTRHQDVNKEIARKYPEEVISEGNLDLIDEIIADDYVEYNSARPEPLHGPDEVREYVSTLRTAVPDIRCGVEDLIAEGDMVVRRDRATGTHEGGFMGIEAAGEAVVEGIHIHRIEDGQLVETWAQNDVMGLLQQLGAIELPGE